MSLFSFSAAISNLVGNTPGANVTNLVTVLNDVKTFLNGANLDDTNMATTNKSTTLKGDVNLLERVGCSGTWGTVVAGTYVPIHTGAIVAQGSNNAIGSPVFYFDPAQHVVSGRTTALQVHATMTTNSTAPTGNFTFGLYPVTAVNGAANNSSLGTGTVTSGSTCVVSAPGTNATFHAESSDFSAPSAGYFILGFATSATGAANSFINVRIELVKHYT